MHARTTPKRDGMPKELWLGLGAFILLGMLWLAWPSATSSRAPAAPSLGQVGSTGQIVEGVLWVDQAGQRAWDRAYADRDQRGQDRAFALFETLHVTGSPRVRVTARDGELMQVELLDGPLAGRRGWGHRTLLSP